MVKAMTSEFDWYKSKNLAVKQRGSIALASAYVRQVKASAFSSTRFVWPSSMDNESKYMTRRVYAKTVSNV